MRSSHRRFGRTSNGARSIVALCIVVISVIGFADRAEAHEQLLTSEPANGAVLDAAPATVRLVFSGPVDVAAMSVSAVGSDGDELTTGPLQHSPGQPDEIVFSVEPTTAGSTTVSWWLVGEDGHPLRGAFRWAVGTESPGDGALVADADSSAAPADDDPTRADGALEIDGPASAARLLTYLSLALLIGLPVFLLFVWPEGARHAMTSVLLVAGAVVGMAGPVLRLGAAAYSLRLPGGTTEALTLVMRAESSRALLAEVALIPILGQLAWHATRPGRTGWWRAPAAITAVAVTWTQVRQGHGSTSTAIGAVGQIVHVVSVSVWAGSLVTLLVVALPTWARRGRFNAEARLRLRSFSRLATIDLVALLGSGTVLLYDRWARENGLSDGYTTALLAKLATVALAVVAAVGCHRWLARNDAPSRPGSLTRRIALETGSLGAVLAVTAVLAGASFLPPIVPLNPNAGVTGNPDRIIEIASTSFVFQPALLTVQADEEIQVAFVADDTMHDFVIEGSEAPIAAIPGMVGRGYFRIDRPGTYAFYCSIDGHREAGMTGTLVVEE